MSLATTPERPSPESTYVVPESIELSLIPWDSVVLVMARYHAAQPPAHGWSRVMQAAPEFMLDLSQLGPVVSINSAEPSNQGFIAHFNPFRTEILAERCVLKLDAIRMIGRLALRHAAAIGVLN